jgi:hypothetical protein
MKALRLFGFLAFLKSLQFVHAFQVEADAALLAVDFKYFVVLGSAGGLVSPSFKLDSGSRLATAGTGTHLPAFKASMLIQA